MQNVQEFAQAKFKPRNRTELLNPQHVLSGIPIFQSKKLKNNTEKLASSARYYRKDMV
mgnify:FL=1